ncbi:MAG TPA: FHA domain-containing protein, partial [Thermoanaerobaculia bacterium]
IVAGEGAGTVFPLTEAAYLIGRASDAAIQLLDLGVSGRHARMYRGPDGYVIEDLKSRNGTWVNGMRVANSLLCDGDRLRVGTTDLRYEVLYDGARAEAAAAVINLR